jgi:hypothetical protein
MIVVAALAAAGLAVSCDPARAAPAWLKRAFTAHHGGDLNRGAAAPKVARYRVDEGGVFILDRTSRHPLLRFEDSSEVWVLTAARGPRGDMIFSNDEGQLFLRMTRLGGVTVFTPRRPEGSAAAVAGAAIPFRLASVGVLGLYQRLLQASVRCSRAAGRLIGFEAPDADPASDALIADAASVAGDAIVALSNRSGGRAILARVAKVDIEHGRQPGAYLRGGVVIITVTPAEGFGGRPSSMRILAAVESR